MSVTGSVYEHTCEFLDKYVDEWFSRDLDQPLVVFISGPQGSGKSYNGQKIFTHLRDRYIGKNVAYSSIDDFYLTHEDQQALALQYKENKLLQGRGLPGTHDLTLLNDCLGEVLGPRKEGTMNLPQYDKSLFSGEGGRSGKSSVSVKLPVDIFILEGWFLGFEPHLQTVEKDLIDGDMADVNAKLFMYSDLLWNNPEVHSLGVILATDDIQNVYEWRTQQEHETIHLKGNGMSDNDVRRFVDRYMPCYELYYEDFVRGENLGSVATLTIGIDKKRQVFSVKTRAIE
ncbi:similar to Saccharomyces cerevisiae YGR205W TDA10 ATP-binding protein of unknown function [Maudiozyma barnettii]|uniref:Uncharacterized protein n=1 Tax=Maudiozyma barnettii TaxID=61262 RepID=A0A8H2VJG5_9SACH|nr:putative ATP-dependent kinase [Kazachstania barnettii]CAB4256455.1 similar to Saccharomyces cerevisiae YGR205W TDA10 ATP-binding protein of unknown function [Kazachstania barnettii]CAD1785064.1 similar to Saccharomyces cerevisiae YGR205W TDA10 ATP-binding protein of unknown function [Kazachstania barnettii]